MIVLLSWRIAKKQRERRLGGREERQREWKMGTKYQRSCQGRAGMDDKAQDKETSEEMRQELIMHQYASASARECVSVCVCVGRGSGRGNVAQLPQKAH